MDFLFSMTITPIHHLYKFVPKIKVVPGFEPGLVGSKPTVITTTLYNLKKYTSVIEKVRKRFLIKLDLSLLIYIIKAWFPLQSEV